jgi:hypothetical protein
MWYLKGRRGSDNIFMHVESAHFGELGSELCNLPTLLTQTIYHLRAAFVRDGSSGMVNDSVCCESSGMALCSIAPSYVKRFYVQSVFYLSKLLCRPSLPFSLVYMALLYSWKVWYIILNMSSDGTESRGIFCIKCDLLCIYGNIRPMTNCTILHKVNCI